MCYQGERVLITKSKRKEMQPIILSIRLTKLHMVTAMEIQMNDKKRILCCFHRNDTWWDIRFDFICFSLGPNSCLYGLTGPFWPNGPPPPQAHRRPDPTCRRQACPSAFPLPLFPFLPKSVAAPPPPHASGHARPQHVVCLLGGVFFSAKKPRNIPEGSGRPQDGRHASRLGTDAGDPLHSRAASPRRAATKKTPATLLSAT